MERIKIENFESQIKKHKYCCICLNSIKTCVAGEEPALLNFIFKHLKLNLSDLSNAIVCENCVKPFERFLQLSNTIEKIRLEMGYCLEVILKAILKAEEVNVASEISSARESLLLKCHKEVRRSRPQVKLRRLDPAVFEKFKQEQIQSQPQLSDCSDDWTPSLVEDFDSNPNEYEDVAPSPISESIKLIKSEINSGKTADRPFKCDNCNRSFKTNPHLNSHKKWSHPGESIKLEINPDIPNPTKKRKRSYPKRGQKFKCPKCPRMLSRKYLSKHIKSFHLKIKPHQCDMCDKSFAEQDMLYRHKTAYHGPKHSNLLNLEFPCKLCGKSFSCSSFLEKHLKDVHRERKFACQICDKRFKLKNHLEKHVSSIHEKKRYPCEFPGCGKDYCQLVPLVQHYRLNHPGFYKSTRSWSGNARKYTMKREGGKVIVECDICKEIFKSQKLCQTHLWRVHDTRKYKCQDCPLKFANKSTLRRHWERKHADKLERKTSKISVKTEAVEVFGRDEMDEDELILP